VLRNGGQCFNVLDAPSRLCVISFVGKFEKPNSVLNKVKCVRNDGLINPCIMKTKEFIVQRVTGEEAQ
jgi:hypothetical protein